MLLSHRSSSHLAVFTELVYSLFSGTKFNLIKLFLKTVICFNVSQTGLASLQCTQNIKATKFPINSMKVCTDLIQLFLKQYLRLAKLQKHNTFILG